MNRLRISREMWLAGAMAVALLAAVGWCWNEYAMQRDVARQSADDLALCWTLAARIEGSRPADSASIDTADQPADAARRISAAATTAGMPRAAISRIEPAPARRAAGGAFLERRTEVGITRTSLQQLLTFLHTLNTSDRPLRVERLRIAAPADSAGLPADGGTWTADITLTNRTFAPSPPTDATIVPAIP